MQEIKICGNIKCQKPFPAVNSVQRFCCRRCFKVDYHRRARERARKEKEDPKLPLRVCDFCRYAYTIPFDIIKYPKKFDEWTCPVCGVPNEILWRAQSSPQSRQLIFSAMMQIRNGNLTTNYMQIMRIQTTP